MIVFTGATRGARWAAKLVGASMGECVVRGELPPLRAPWFYDPGGFRDHCAGRPFDAAVFDRDMRRIRLWSVGGVPRWTEPRLLPPPTFILLPDIVAGGKESLVESERWAVEGPIGGWPDAPLYLAVQDGMLDVDVFLSIHRMLTAGINVSGLFVGGSMPWKIATGASWVGFAHHIGLRCHIGRAMSKARIAWAQRIGADSIDGNAPNWSEAGLERAVRALGEQPQLSLGLDSKVTSQPEDA